MSGGVDSAVSAALLQKVGYEVIGVFIKTWHPEFLVCNEEEEIHDAMRITAHLNIPFLTFDFKDVYKKEVADYMIREYKMGRTPNPDVMCNQEIKFGAFLKKAISLGADFIATGHYARKEENAFSLFLQKGVDSSKDQSYFLWTLRQEQLKKILFPVGCLKKTEVRKLAKKFNLPIANKKDSQGICFLGEIDLKEFLKHYIKEKKGKVMNTFGEEIGYHAGVFFHTLGERHGFTITKKNSNDGPYYIISKDIEKNILFVSKNKDKDFLQKSADIFLLSIENANWISKVPEPNKIYTAQIRYHGKFLPCKIRTKSPERGQKAEIIFKKPVLVASGQSCVIYDKSICLGGGIVI